MDNGYDVSQAAERPLVTLRELAERTGRSVSALRKQVERGRLKARRGNNGQWLVAVDPTTLSHATSHTTVVRQTYDRSQQLYDMPEGVEHLVARPERDALLERATRAEGEVSRLEG